MYILGIGGFYHDSAACLIKDGEILFAAEEERFSRIKHTDGLPVEAIEYCLKKEAISFEQIDHVSYYMRQGEIILGNIKDLISLKRPLVPAIRLLAYSIHELAALEVGKLRLSEKIGCHSLPKFTAVKHHLAHAASAFFVSPFNSSAILTLDLMGEDTSTAMLIGELNKLKIIEEIKFPDSIGMLYASITDYLGFKVTSDEYKVMGLASYGKLDHYGEFRKIVKLGPRGKYKINLEYFNFHITGRPNNSTSSKFLAIFGPPRRPEDPILQRHKDIASCLQKLTQEIIMHLVEHIYNVTGLDNLCIAGGVGLNSVANGQILRDGPFKNIFIQPSAHDAGCAIGGAYYLYHQILGNPRKYIQKHDYFGPEFSDEQIESVLNNSKIKYKYFSDIERITAELIAQGKIVGWFQGKMEMGPRALGNRSILADPTKRDMMDIINKWVKHREDFRPFAPAILEEEATKYFDIDCPSPFMLFVVPVRESMKDKIPAVVHVDGTARVQTVSKKSNPRFWRLIDEFNRLQGVPVVLNTSFNIRGEPIVCTPNDALRCFFSTGIDSLIIGDYLIEK